MIYLKFPISFLKWLFILCICLFSNHATSQCAGVDGAVTVCNKDADQANKTFSLFPHLSGTPTAGGIWSTNDPANFFALDRTNGIVNLWEVKNSGLHEFTYTNNTCGETAIVTISLGGYPGEDNIDGSADACGDNPAVNLHSFIGDETEGKFQDFNGIWDAVTPEAIPHLNQNIFDAESAGTGIYEFTHTVPVVATCASRQVRLILEVQRPANSGIASNLTVCTTDDLSGLTNYDLNTLLFDEDVNGTWSEGPLTDQLEDLTDNIINVEAIRDRHTYGTFSFTYTVFPAHAVCEVNRTTVEIIILPTLQGTMEAANYCAGPSDYTINITDYNDTLITNGTYEAHYSLTSASSTGGGVTPLILRDDRTGYFRIDADQVAINETTTLTITSLGTAVCSDIQVVPVSFIVSNPNANVSDSCEAADVPVTLTGIFDASMGLANGNYDVIYTVMAPSGTNDSFTVNAVSFTLGSASLTIPAAQITETGDYDIKFEVASGFPLDCEITDTATITPIPQAIDLDLVIDNTCDATQIDVMVDAPVLADGGYVVTYEVISQETNAVLIDNTINFAGGTADYQIDVATLTQGNYTVTVRSTQNDTTPCRVEFDFELNENFAIEGVPELPVAEAQQTLCLSAFSPNSPTLEDIVVSANGQILFYATATDMSILALDTPLVDGEDYYVSNTDPNNNCEGSERVQVMVNLANPEIPTATNLNPTFCASENPTVSSLNNSVNSSGNLVWFESASGGIALENSLSLVDGVSYFAASETSGQCLSNARLEIVPTVFELGPASLLFTNLALCGLDNPTVADLGDAESNNPFHVLWYDTPENGSPLADDVPLIGSTSYYAESFNPDTGCMNPERLAVTIDLSNCDPEDYGFFIPDGFSPNGDGRNDTFFIPNIEIIFPDFTMEILNRYGSRLFKGYKNNPAWDGSNGDAIAPNGVYFYIIDYKKDGHNPVQGRLYLNR